MVVEVGFVVSGIIVGATSGSAVGFSSSFSARTSGSRCWSGNAASSGAETVSLASVFSSIVLSSLFVRAGIEQ